MKFNLQTGRPVCMSLTLEGREEVYTHPQQHQPNEGKPSLHFLHFRRSRRSLRKTCHVTAERLGENDTCNIIIKQFQKPQGFRVIYGVVLLLGVESLMIGSTTGVLMSPGPHNIAVLLLNINAVPAYTTKAPMYYTTKALDKLWRRIKYYTNEASKYYTTIYAASRCITKEPEPIPGNVNLQMGRPLRAVLLFGVVSLMVGSTTGVPMSPGYGGYQATAAKEYYTTSPPYYNTTTATPPRLKSYATNYAAPSCITKAPEYYITEAPKYYTTEYSVPAYYTAVPKYYTTTNAS
ncbi:hypothetical protein DAPPUDRAFT_239175 [Daphnia pulex]|uniref:Uncharacterized protein n=1 Tax=Daphnia pulex TaxID=6669 RepID=E9G8J5_DAPPU|nr:hypothetical protein DAPPUDRAFT_239175 [Daphnia pulex]|eukprot:EFX83985.1 hypothetical protein DAPPUDRAFT_239175 [Daphnia pulex]